MNRKVVFVLCFVAGLLPIQAQVTGFSIVKPNGAPGSFLTLPGSQRRIALRCASGCSTAGVATWTVAAATGGASATLNPSPSGNYVDVTVGPTAGSCPVTGANPNFNISPTAIVTLQAKSLDDPTQFDTVDVAVCSPAVEAYTIPFYRVLFSGQREDVQGVVWGSPDTTGTWQIISQPSGGDGVLDDTTNSDTVFHATVQGLYKVQWNSSADSTKTAYSTFYVTGNPQTRVSTPNGTEPIDCTADPNTTGGVLDVGPTQTYTNLEAISQNMMVPGVTIRLHNEDTTGQNPTTYHEWIQIGTRAAHDNPVRLCGVPDAAGNLPVMDGTNATGRSDVLSPNFVSGAAAVYVYNKNYDPYPGYTGPQYIVVEGIAFRNYSPTNAYYPAGTSSGATTTYVHNAAGFRFQVCRDCELNGSESSFNGNGVFAEGNDANAWGGISERLLFEGNNVHDNGVTGDSHEHNWYLQAWYQVVQFNQIPTYNTRALGSQYKDRGISWFRYNYVGTGAARVLDLVEDQDAPHYMDPAFYLLNLLPAEPKDQYTGDQLAAAQEAWHHSEFVYGNIFAEATGGSVHFAADSNGGSLMRTGNLEFYNNTVNAVAKNVYRYSWFDTGDHGNNFPHWDWPVINVANVVAGGWTNSLLPFFSWNSQRDTYMNFGRVLLPSSWGTNAQSCINNATGLCDPTGWPYTSNTDLYFDGNAFHATGTANFITGATTPWNAGTYQLTIPLSGLPLTGAQAALPVRFQYVPAQGYAAPRSTVVTSTVGGTIGATDSVNGGGISVLSAQTITFPAIPDQTAGLSSVALNATASSGLPVSYAVVSGPATVSGNTVSLTGATGTVIIQAGQGGDATYAPAPTVSQSFNVALATGNTPQTITFPAIAPQAVGNAPIALAATASSGLPVSYTVLSGPGQVSGNILTVGEKGTVTIQANQTGDATYSPAPPVTQSFTVGGTAASLTAQTITFPPIAAQAFGSPSFTLNASASSGLAVSYVVLSGPAAVSGNAVTLTGAGSVTIQANQAGSSTYAAAPAVSQSFSVSQASQTITFPAISSQTTGNALTLNATASSGLAIAYAVVSGPATVSGNTVTFTGSAGTVVIQASQPGNANYTAAPAVSQSFSVTVGATHNAQTIMFPAIPLQTITSPAFTLNATASSGLAVTYTVVSGPANVSGSTVSLTGVAGTVVIQANQAGNGTYSAAPAARQSFTVSLLPQTITFPAIAGHTVGSAAFTLAATASSKLTVTYSVVSGPATVSGSTVTLTGSAGTVVIKASQAGNATYTAATAVSQSFVVAAASQTITFPTIAAHAVGNPAFALGATASSKLLVTYSVTSGPATVSGNMLTLTGTAGTVTVKASQAGNAGYAAAPALSQSFKVAMGTQTITFSAIAKQTLGNAPVTLNATASSKLPVSYAVVSGPGRLNGNVLTLTGLPGTIVVKATQAGNAGYTAAGAVSQSITVVVSGHTAQTITFPVIPTHQVGDNPFSLGATASSGLTVTYAIVSGPATLMRNVVHINGPGKVTVQATQVGNTTYAAAVPVTRIFTVLP